MLKLCNQGKKSKHLAVDETYSQEDFETNEQHLSGVAVLS